MKTKFREIHLSKKSLVKLDLIKKINKKWKRKKQQKKRNNFN